MSTALAAAFHAAGYIPPNDRIANMAVAAVAENRCNLDAAKSAFHAAILADSECCRYLLTELWSKVDQRYLPDAAEKVRRRAGTGQRHFENQTDFARSAPYSNPASADGAGESNLPGLAQTSQSQHYPAKAGDPGSISEVNTSCKLTPDQKSRDPAQAGAAGSVQMIVEHLRLTDTPPQQTTELARADAPDRSKDRLQSQSRLDRSVAPPRTTARVAPVSRFVTPEARLRRLNAPLLANPNSLLNTFLIDGVPLGDVTVRDARAWADRRVVEARLHRQEAFKNERQAAFIARLTENLPADAQIKTFRDAGVAIEIARETGVI